MRALALDPVTGDLAVARGRLQLVDGLEAIRQRLQVRLRLWQGEWFADASLGVPFLDFLGTKGTEALAESIFREAITTAPGIAALEDLSLVGSASRRATVTFRARATTGEVLSVTDFVAGGS